MFFVSQLCALKRYQTASVSAREAAAFLTGLSTENIHQIAAIIKIIVHVLLRNYIALCVTGLLHGLSLFVIIGNDLLLGHE